MGVGGQIIIPVGMEHKFGNQRWRKCFLKCQQKERQKGREEGRKKLKKEKEGRGKGKERRMDKRFRLVGKKEEIVQER